MTEYKCSDLDLKKIAESGQCFRMNEEGEGKYKLVAFGRLLRLEQKGPGEVVFNCPEAEFESIWRDYFDLNADYAAYRASVDPDDIFLTEAAEEGKGIRILRQDPWETLITFIISQRKNIPAIKACVEALCRRFGKPLDEEGVFAFPEPEDLACADETCLKDCSLGYRVPYVSKAARMVCDGAIDLNALNTLDDGPLLETLMTVPGVGPKVGNCVSLFAYHRIAAFPIDVWIGRMLEQHYGGVFPLERYEGYAGIMQQYIFYHALMSKKV